MRVLSQKQRFLISDFIVCNYKPFGTPSHNHLLSDVLKSQLLLWKGWFHFPPHPLGTLSKAHHKKKNHKALYIVHLHLCILHLISQNINI